MLVFIYISVPESSCIGHLSGIVACLVLMYSGAYNIFVLPQVEWIQDWEEQQFVTQLEAKVSYFRA